MSAGYVVPDALLFKAGDAASKRAQRLKMDVHHGELLSCVEAALAAVLPLAIEAERDRCARVVEEGQETHRSTADGDTRFLTPRKHGNLSGLAYAAAIRGDAT